MPGTMKEPEADACARASLGHDVTVDVWTGEDRKTSVRKLVGSSGSTKTALPKMLSHGTSMQNGLSILKDGSINPSEGIAGFGVYAFEIKLDDEGKLNANELSRMRDMSASGG